MEHIMKNTKHPFLIVSGLLSLPFVAGCIITACNDPETLPGTIAYTAACIVLILLTGWISDKNCS